MRVAALAEGLKHSRLVKGDPRAEIVGITNDSRSVRTGMLYAALRGEHLDGHEFIRDALAKGARAVLCEKLPAESPGDVAWFAADHARPALSELSDRFYGAPSRDLTVIGVTGTDGKTSTVYYIHQLLQTITGSSSFLSTAAMQIGRDEQPNMLHQSTPEAPEVHRVLRAMVDAGSRFCVLESTSHGLARTSCRLAHVRYDVAVFTNLSHEHLEYHGTFEKYRSDKANLFRALDAGCYAEAVQPQEGEAPAHSPGGGAEHLSSRSGDAPRRTGRAGEAPFGVVNRDDPNASYFRRATASPIVTYGLSPGADFGARDLELETTGTSFTLVSPEGDASCRLPVPGRFSVLNVLAAAAVVQGLTGCDAPTLARSIERLRSVRGRMTVVTEKPFSVVVDYAHTPGSFENVLPFFREQCAGRLIVVFGSAGERDLAKRPLQGEIADRYADVSVLADEDPRGEEPMSILREIAAGSPSRTEGRDIFLIPDRRAAVRQAFTLATTGDTVLLLGKGHEATIIGATQTVPWDEIEVAKEELDRIGSR